MKGVQPKIDHASVVGVLEFDGEWRRQTGCPLPRGMTAEKVA
jgi:hypothetical protein